MPRILILLSRTSVKELASFSQDRASLMVTLTMALTMKLDGAEIGHWIEPYKRSETYWAPRRPSVVRSMGTKEWFREQQKACFPTILLSTFHVCSSSAYSADVSFLISDCTYIPIQGAVSSENLQGLFPELGFFRWEKKRQYKMQRLYHPALQAKT